MLSRRRSSEQTSATDAASPATLTPTEQRLQGALRGALVLFSVPAQLDPAATPTPAPVAASAHLPRPPKASRPDQSGDLAGSTTEPSGIRRLFARERRRGLPPSAPDSRPVHHLVVASYTRHRDQIRLHQLVDGGSGARVAIHGTWFLSDLRKIDGLGRPVAQSVHFALYFSSSPRAIAWRATSPSARAVFLWALLQTCVSRLSRAPPVTNLRLLDLQTTAESAESLTDARAAGDNREEPVSSDTFKGSAHMASSLEELGDQRSTDMLHTAAPISDSFVNVPASPKAAASVSGHINASSVEDVKRVPGLRASPVRAKSDEVIADVMRSEEAKEPKAEVAKNGADKEGDAPRDLSKSSKVKRTLSEPKATAIFACAEDDSDVDGSEGVPRKADTMAPWQRGADPDLKDLNIDERAFLAAAKRLGAKKSFDLKRADQVDKYSSYGSDPKARLFQNRLKISEANTRKVVAERKMLQERKLYMLSSKEQEHLALALDMFGQEKPEDTLEGFGSWVSSHIQTLEVENIADLVSVEKQTMSKGNETEFPSAHAHASHVLDESEVKDGSFGGLVRAMTAAQPWLDKCQTLLAPYAELVEDINHGVNLLETQRKNVSALDELLSELVNALSFEYSEKSLVDGVGTCDPAFELSEFDTDDFQSAVQIIVSKVGALERLSHLSEMSAVKEVQNLLSQRQREASSLLLPVLRDYINKSYESHSSEDLKLRFGGDLVTPKDSASRRDFLTNVSHLSNFRTSALQELMDHYVLLSSKWIVETVRLLISGLDSSVVEEPAEDVHQRRDTIRMLAARNLGISEALLAACVAEGLRCCHLFRSACELVTGDDKLTLSGLLRRQVDDGVFLTEFITGPTVSDPILGACVHQHASYLFQRFAERLSSYDVVDTPSLLDKISQLISDNSPVKKDFILRASEELNKQVDPLMDDSTTHCSDVDAVEDAHSEVPLAHRGSQCLRIVISVFEEVCRCLSITTLSMSEDLVKTSLASLERKRDVASEDERREFFSIMVSAVDLCCEMAFLPGLAKTGSPSVLNEPVKSVCERLIVTAMKSTEVSVQSCAEDVAEAVKLQNYGYIAARLSEDDTPDFLRRLSHLATRVRKHLVGKWLERQSFGSICKSLKRDTSMRYSGAHAHFNSIVDDLDVAETAARLKEAVHSTMESAAETKATQLLYGDVIVAAGEVMEDVIKMAKKEKVGADARAKLQAFSRALLDVLKANMIQKHRKR